MMDHLVVLRIGEDCVTLEPERLAEEIDRGWGILVAQARDDGRMMGVHHDLLFEGASCRMQIAGGL